VCDFFGVILSNELLTVFANQIKICERNKNHWPTIFVSAGLFN